MLTHTAGLARDLEVIEALASAEAFTQGGLGVQRIAELTQRDKGQISRVLKTLSETGLVDRDLATRKYSLGHLFYSLAMRTKEAHLALLSETRLFELVAQTQETAHLNVMRGGRILTIKTIVAANATRRSGWDGLVLAAGKTASGRALLATYTDEEISLWWQEHAEDEPLESEDGDLPEALEPINPKGGRGKKPAANLEEFVEMIQEIRDRGYAISDGEFQSGIVDAAAVVRGASNAAIGAISVGAPKERIRDQFDSLGQIVASAAMKLSVDLGAPIVGPV